MNWMRVGAAALLTGASVLLVACGSGDVVSDLDFQKGTQLRSNSVPEKGRIITIGDDFSDIGQGMVYSVRDGTSNWVQQLAGHYGVKLVPAKDGGWAYAQGKARVDAIDPDADAPSVKEQVDQLLSDTGGKLRQADMVFINGGMHDIMDAVEGNNSATNPGVRQEVLDAADALVEQVTRLVNAGAGHVAVSDVYDLGTTPWAIPWGHAEPEENSDLSELVVGLKEDFPGFNGHLKVELVRTKVLYLETARFFKLVYDANKRDPYLVTNVKESVCRNPELLQGCDKSDVLAGRTNYNTYLFADDVHFTPNAWRAYGSDNWGDNAYQRVVDNWGRP